MLIPNADLVSLVMICCGNRAFTAQSLTSIFQHTRVPYELVLVDNGSSDDTGPFLATVRQQPGPARVVVLTNADNRGFPTACNQGLAQAKGTFVVFLHNDVLVSAGWLEGLLASGRHNWPAVGLVGPVTNHGVDTQTIPFEFTSVAALERFADQRRVAFSGQARSVKRLSTCCLLVRRDVLDQLGPLDERFSPGFFEDEDLCVRARAAGHKLVVASGIYVHHHGGVTFNSLETNFDELFARNLDLFREKWGLEHSAAYHSQWYMSPASGEPPGAAASEEGPLVSVGDSALPMSANALSPRRVSLCMMVKNEEANLLGCLQSVHALVDEIQVVDTGSSDQTRDVARQFGAWVHDVPWDNSSVARNECLGHARGEWILWLDASDRLDQTNCHHLKTLIKHLSQDDIAYAMSRWSLPDPRTGTIVRFDQIRLFRNHPAIRWQYRVNEQILDAVRAQGHRVVPAGIAIHQLISPEERLGRLQTEHNLRSLLLDYDRHPDDAFILFNLGSTYLDLGRPTEALPFLQRSLERASPKAAFARKSFALLVHTLRHLFQCDQALAVCQIGRQRYPHVGDLLFEEGLLQSARGEWDRAEAAMQELLTPSREAYFFGVDAGRRGYKARHQLALIELKRSRLVKAELHWREAVAEKPEFVPAWLGLAELQLAQEREAELTALVVELEQRSATTEPAALIRAKLHHHRGEKAPARQLLEEARDRRPQWLHPRLLLSQFHLQEGDRLAAAKALEEVLALDPTHLQARCQLRELRERNA